METKFTKGKWQYSLNNNKIQVIIPTSFPTKLILGTLSSDDCSHPKCCKIEEHSNAKLIAAAPEMFAELLALKEKVSRVSTGYPPVDYELQQWITRVDELIKKAI